MKTKLVYLLALFTFLANDLVSQQINWENTIQSGNGSGFDGDFGRSIISLANNESIVFGTSRGNIGLDKSEDNYEEQGAAVIRPDDYWVMRLDALGEIIWENTLGGIYNDEAATVIRTSDGNILLGGSSASPSSPDKSDDNIDGGPQGRDYWIVKMDLNGNIIWDTTIGGTNRDLLMDMVELSNGDIVLTGISNSGVGGDKTEPNLGEEDFWVVKISSTGTVIWDKTLGGVNRDRAQSVIALQGDFIAISGWSNSPSSSTKSEDAIGGTYDFWVVLMDANGGILWDNTIGGDQDDAATDIILYDNSELIVVGTSESSGSFDKQSINYGSTDVWVVSLSNTGALNWEKNFGASGSENWPKVKTNNDDIFVMASSRSPNDFDRCSFLGATDLWVFALDSNYDLKWEQEFGGPGEDQVNNGYGDFVFDNNSLSIVTTSSSPSSLYKSENSTSNDYWVLNIGVNDQDCCITDPAGHQALEALYNSTSGDQWINNNGWLVDCDYCNWFGVSCNINGEITMINLPNNNLDGPIIPSFSDFTELFSLDLSGNSLSGGIPDFTGLDDLEWISLQNNMLSGTVPPQLGEVPLSGLNISNNNLSGCFPPELSSLCNIGINGATNIDAGNSFDITWIDFCSGVNCCSHPDLPGLQAFYDAANGDQWTNTVNGDRPWFEDCDPCGLVDGTPWYGITCDGNNMVTVLNLSNNSLSGEITADIDMLTSLSTAVLYDNSGLTGSIPSSICNLPSFTTLYIFRNNHTGVIPPCMANMSSLVDINFNDNSISGPIPPFGSNTPNLFNLNLNNNNLTGGLPASLADIPNPSTLTFNDNMLSGCYPPVLLDLCDSNNGTIQGLSNSTVSDGNNFDEMWDDFCATGDGACITDCCGEAKLIGTTNDENSGIIKEVNGVRLLLYTTLLGGYTYAAIARLDNNNDIVWNNRITEPSQFLDFEINDDGNILVVGRTTPVAVGQTNQCIMGIIDSNTGSVIAMKKHEFFGRQTFSQILKHVNPKNTDYPYYIIGIENGNPSNSNAHDDVIVLNVDDQLQVNWSYKYLQTDDNQWLRDIVGLSNGDICIVGDQNGKGVVVTLDGASGDVLMFSESADDLAIYGIKELSSGNFVSVGRYAGPNDNNGLLTYHGADLSVIDAMHFDGQISFFYSITETTMGNYVAAGSLLSGKTVLVEFAIANNSIQLQNLKILDHDGDHVSRANVYFENGKLLYTESIENHPMQSSGTDIYFAALSGDLSDDCLVDQSLQTASATFSFGSKTALQEPLAVDAGQNMAISIFNHEFDDACMTTSVQEHSDLEINIYPNPTSGLITIAGYENRFESYAVYNLTGSVVMNGRMSPLSTTLNLSGVNAGIYFIRMFDKEGNIVTKKILIANY